MSPEPTKVQVEYINEDRDNKVKSAKWMSSDIV